MIPGLFGWLYVRAKFTDADPGSASAKAILGELRSAGAILFSLLLFFQFVAT